MGSVLSMRGPHFITPSRPEVVLKYKRRCSIPYTKLDGEVIRYSYRGRVRRSRLITPTKVLGAG